MSAILASFVVADSADASWQNCRAVECQQCFRVFHRVLLAGVCRRRTHIVGPTRQTDSQLSSTTALQYFIYLEG